MVEKIEKSDWGMNTNFKKALDMILDAIISQRLLPNEVEGMTLVILSDMQCDQADNSGETMYILRLVMLKLVKNCLVSHINHLIFYFGIYVLLLVFHHYLHNRIFQ